jgi:single-stranded-DNA-specific exonuclease
MIQPAYRWRFPAGTVIPPELLEAGGRLGLSARLVAILLARGLRSPAELAGFVAEPVEGLHDPFLLPDAAIFLDRCRVARKRGETVLVFGDFDADGLTGLAIMTTALRRFGLRVEPYVPSRLEEGHGLSLRAVQAAVQRNAGVIVTVDCGSTSGPEIQAATEAGIDVLVTDHHRLPEVLPPALALVNPHRADSRYPDQRLAGSGVAFKLAQLLARESEGGRPADDQALDLTQLAMIGTVADVAPVLGENRAIARLGLERLRSSPRPGLAAMLAGASIPSEAVDLETVAYDIAPRLNAAGRVGEAMEAARLLLTEDPEEAVRLAATLEAANATRRDLTIDAMTEALVILETMPDEPITMVHGGWPVGVVGLMASKLAEDRGRPAIVGTAVGAVIRASCRSARGFDLAAALEACSDLLLRYGGHPGAAGFEVAPENWEALRARLAMLAAADLPAPEEHRRPELVLDIALRAAEVDYGLIRELASLAPTGPGNPDPLVGVLGLTVSRVRSANGGHTQLTLRREKDVLDAIAFGRADLAEALQEGDRVDVVARLASRAFGGIECIQLEVRDLAPSGLHEPARAILGAEPAGPVAAIVASVAASPVA